MLISMILSEARCHRKNLKMVWVDYRKAYNSVPHSWMMECSHLMKAHFGLCSFVESSMKCWKTKLLSNDTSFGAVVATLMMCSVKSTRNTLIEQSLNTAVMHV